VSGDLYSLCYFAVNMRARGIERKTSCVMGNREVTKARILLFSYVVSLNKIAQGV
jgi:hypothetical protein